MASLHFLVQDDRCEVQNHFLGHMMPLELALVSYDPNSIVNATITLIRSRCSKWNVRMAFSIALLHSLCPDEQSEVQHNFLGHYVIGASVTWCQWHHCIPQDKMIEMGCNMTFLVMLCHWHWWCNQYYQCHHYILWVNTIKIWCNMAFLVMWHNFHWH